MKSRLPLFFLFVAFALYSVAPIPPDPVSIVIAGTILGAVAFGLGFWWGRKSLRDRLAIEDTRRWPKLHFSIAFLLVLVTAVLIAFKFDSVDWEDETVVHVVLDKPGLLGEQRAADLRSAIERVGFTQTSQGPRFWPKGQDSQWFMSKAIDGGYVGIESNDNRTRIVVLMANRREENDDHVQQLVERLLVEVMAVWQKDNESGSEMDQSKKGDKDDRQVITSEAPTC